MFEILYFVKNKNELFYKNLTYGLIILAVGFGLGSLWGGHESKAMPAVDDAGKPISIDAAPFWQLWSDLDNKFVYSDDAEKINNEDKLYGAMKGLASSYGDPYTVYMPPEEAKVFEGDIKGNFEGVGMEIGMRDGALTVIAPLKGTPAEKAGILPGDVIVGIDGKSTDKVSVEDAVKLIRGPQGSTVKFSILRDGKVIELDAVRDVIDIPTINTKIVGDTFVIELYSFSATSPNLFRGALKEFANSGLHNLVLDLRGNPGGFLDAAVDMASFFLPAGKTVVTEDFGNGKDSVHRSKGYNVFNDNLNMAVLIDGGSASASEILAGALSQNGVATLIGTRSFGKGSVQELIPIDTKPSSSLKVTIAHWKTPNGSSISGNGLTPDIEVVDETPNDTNDEVLNKAVKFLDSK